MQLTLILCTMIFLGPKDEYFDQISPSDVFLKYFDTDVVQIREKEMLLLSTEKSFMVFLESI